jgi:hypothetical protein
MNCHPAGDRPRQGDIRRLHQPPVTRGEDGFGLPALHCPICHQQANFDPGRMPGDPAWHLAPRDIGWEGKTVGQISNLRCPPFAPESEHPTYAPQGRKLNFKTARSLRVPSQIFLASVPAPDRFPS